MGWESANVESRESVRSERSIVIVCDSAMSAKSMAWKVSWRGVGY